MSTKKLSPGAKRFLRLAAKVGPFPTSMLAAPYSLKANCLVCDGPAKDHWESYDCNVPEHAWLIWECDKCAVTWAAPSVKEERAAGLI